ncbi:MAG: glycosyltransferase family 2 protein [Candidatus Gastranaerophilales bacterium]|nr:glycosyltransferase family 2 protein [Candidatus Gastranaerophilales bacterium]
MEQSLNNKLKDDLQLEEYCFKEPFMEPKVSIIVPAFNTEKYILKCLLSLIKQTLKEIEIIVVNDGSTDGTLSVIEKLSSLDARIKVINQENQKQGAARNRGMEIATGEYIGFVDSDDWVDLDYFEKLYLAAKKYNSDIALATNVRIGNGKTKKRLCIQKEEFVQTLQEKIDISQQANNPCPTNKIYSRKSLIDNNLFWSEGVYCEDKLFTMQAIYYANGLVCVPDVSYYYFRRPNSTVNSKAKRLSKDKNNAKRAVLNFLKEKNVQIRDCDFWATKIEIRIFGVTIFRIEESLQTTRVSILGFKILKYKSKEAACE